MKKVAHFLIACIIPIVLFLFGYYWLGYTITGENYIVSDMKGQYLSLFSYLQDVLLGKESLLYSFDKGMGGSMMATFAYYLSSPLNFVIIFFEKVNLPIVLFLLILLKIGLSGGTMFLYLKKHYPQNKKMNLLFSTAYALMGYMVQYYFQIMWLDSIYLLPLILTGIDNLIQKQKKIGYIIPLFLVILSNFYTGYMVCIFALIYFLSQMYLKTKKIRSKTTLHFFICSLLAACLSTWLLLPTILELQNVFRYPVENLWNIEDIGRNFLELLSKLYIGAQNCKNLTNPHGTNIYCGIFSIVLVYLYFKNNNIKRKTKYVYGSLLLILILSSILPILIYIWHGFSIPNYFMNRNSFILTFVLIIIAVESYQYIELKSIKTCIPMLIGYIIISMILLSQEYEYLHLEEVILTSLFMILYFILLLYKKRLPQKNFKTLFVLVALIEIVINFHFTFLGTTEVTKFSELLSSCEQIEENGGRTGYSSSYSGIDALVCRKSMLTSFLSTNTEKTHIFYDKAGYPTTGITQVDFNFNTIVIDSLLGVKTYATSYGESILYEKIEDLKDKDGSILYENPYALSMGYRIDQIVKDIETKNAFEFQNELIMNFSGIQEKPLELIYETKDVKTAYEVTVSKGDYYIQIHYAEGNKLRGDIAKVVANGRELEEWEADGVFQVRDVEDEIVLSIEPDENIRVEGISIYQLNQNVFEKQIEALKQNQVSIDVKDKNKLSGSIRMHEKGIVMFTIPYDSNWKILVDGKQVESIQVANTFLAVPIESSTHEITAIYMPKGLKIGIVISTISLILTILYLSMCKNE